MKRHGIPVRGMKACLNRVTRMRGSHEGGKQNVTMRPEAVTTRRTRQPLLPARP